VGRRLTRRERRRRGPLCAYRPCLSTQSTEAHEQRPRSCLSLAYTTTNPFTCSHLPPESTLLVKGFEVVDAAPLLPTSKGQCRKDGWKTYGVFKNQGDCVSFVATGGKNGPALAALSR
jgi:hypothetical protein